VSWVRKAGVSGSNNPAPQGSGTMDSLTFVRKLVAKGAQLNARSPSGPAWVSPHSIRSARRRSCSPRGRLMRRS
jgi:hypothetical protein